MPVATSCGGVVVHDGQVLLLYKNRIERQAGWVMPKGSLEAGETYKQTALREVLEETGVSADIVKFVGKTRYSFSSRRQVIDKSVFWYLMTSDSFYCVPQEDEYFEDAGYYKPHEAYHLLKFNDERRIMKQAVDEYIGLGMQRPVLRNSTNSTYEKGMYV